MVKRKLNVKKVIGIFEDYFCDGKGAYIFITGKGYKFNYFADKVEVYDIGDTLSITDDNGTEIYIRKDNIIEISISIEDICETITIQTETEIFSFMIA